MSAKRLAWGLWLAFVATLVTAAWIGFHPPPGQEPITVVDALWASSFLGFPTAGALIASRMPARALGWIFLLAPLFILGGVAISEGVARMASPQAAAWSAWLSNILFSAGLSLLVFVPLLVPDGLLPSPRWRALARLLAAGGVLMVLNGMFAPGPLSEFPEYVNPIGIAALADASNLMETLGAIVLFGGVFAGTVSLIVRFRRAHGVERQQMKWIAFGASVVAATMILTPLFQAVAGDLGDVAATLITVVALLALPVTMGISILRYRLYDVDVIINRALVYGALTAFLGLVYLGGVVLLQRVLTPLTAQSDLAVAASTLMVAGLARPLRTRLQVFIDHRFYRRKYDAEETLRAFSGRLRDQVELDALNRELVGVVGKTMQPAHVSLWLRGVGE